MKYINSILILPALLLAFAACDSQSDFPGDPGNPVIASPQVPSQAFFGDSIPFSASVSDTKVALSTLKAQLFYGADMVAETVIRTKTDGQYGGKVFAPFLKDIPDGEASLKLILQDIHFTTAEYSATVALSRPQFEFLTLLTEDGETLQLTRTGTNLYSGQTDTDTPQLLKGTIVAPKYGANGNEISFGWEGSGITENSESPITFLSLEQSPYTISFNTLTYERSPFTVYIMNGKDMNFVDGLFQIDLALKKGDAITHQNIPDTETMWIDPDFFTTGTDGGLQFAAIDGNYRIIVEPEGFRVKTLNADGNKATLKDDGTGAVWIAGWGIAKPYMHNGQPGWSPGKMLCMAPVAQGIYQMTVVASNEQGNGQIRTDYVDFKFFYQDDWGGEFGKGNYAEESGIIPDKIVITDSGNFNLASGQTLTDGQKYIITLDCTDGPSQAKIKIEEAP